MNANGHESPENNSAAKAEVLMTFYAGLKEGLLHPGRETQ